MHVTIFNMSNTHIKNNFNLLYNMSEATEREENKEEAHELENSEQDESE
jgi:hypothetical protein